MFNEEIFVITSAVDSQILLCYIYYILIII